MRRVAPDAYVVWRVRILSISAIVSRFAIQYLLQQVVAEGSMMNLAPRKWPVSTRPYVAGFTRPHDTE